MSEKNKIKCLEEHIRKISEEIALINLKNSKLSAEAYLKEKIKYDTLKNLQAIARNELNSLLHQYKCTLTGKIVTQKGELSQRVVRTKLFTDININSNVPATLKPHVKSSRPLIDLIQKDYSTFFVEGTFEIKRIKQIR